VDAAGKDKLQVAAHELVGAEGAQLFETALAVAVVETHGVQQGVDPNA